MRTRVRIVLVLAGLVPGPGPGCTVPGGDGGGTDALVRGEARGAPGELAGGEVGPPEDLHPRDLVAADVPEPPAPTTLLKGPWLQWVTPERLHVMAESADEVPLVFEVRVDGETRETVTSSPRKIDMTGQTIPFPNIVGWLHEVAVSSVAPGETFEVLVLNSGDSAAGWVPLPGAPVSLVLFGDTRTDPESHQLVVDAIVQEGPAMVLHTGDFVSGGGDPEQWQVFFDIERELMATSFLYTIFGNHEIFGQVYFEAFFHMENTFGTERTWSTVWGDVGIVGMEIYNTDWSDGEALAWLDRELGRLREEARWLIVSFHEPLYTFSNHAPWSKGREYVQPLLEQHAVDLVISGHNHCYEHFLVNEIHHVVSGGGGAPLYGVGEASEAEKELLVMARPGFHYVRVDLTPEQITFSATDAATAEVFDSWTVPSPR
ncbi:MAG: metallophosphoesterase [Deltaproteobacteria bacterium]|nr:metallophosphoesterase [Deltaproteobacteria bacterium]